MAFPTDPLTVTIEAAFGADRTADPAGWTWIDLTDRWHPGAELRIRYGRREGARQSEPAEISFTLKNVDGQLTPEDPRSQWWPHVDEGLPLRVTLDPGVGDPLVFGGFANRLAPRWPGGSAGLALVDVTAGGVLRQDSRGHTPPLSALSRATVADPSTVAHWSMEGLGQVTRVPGLAAGQPLVVRQINAVTPLDHAVEWSADTTGPGLGALPVVRSTQAGVGFTGPIPQVTDRVGWSFWGRGDVDGSLDASMTMWIDGLDGDDPVGWVLWVQWSGPDAATPQILVIVENYVDGALQVSLTCSPRPRG